MKPKEKILFQVIVILTVVIYCFPVNIMANTGQSSGMDAILVLDLSGSMKQTDPEKVALEGAKLFIDMMASSGSRAGFVAFTDKIVQTYNLSTISSVDDKKNIKDAIDILDYSGDTDIGAAANKAIQMLEEASDVGNKKMILLFTDGETDLPKGVPSETEAEAVSFEQANATIASAEAEGIPIYTVGLNANGQVDTALITNMANSTGAKNNIVTSASELPAIFNDIFADFVESEINDLGVITIADSNTFEERTFNIPNDSVLEANIVMITGGTGNLTELELKDSRGNIYQPDGNNIILSMSGNYNMLKMLAPSSGDWILRIKGDQGCEIHVNLLFNYDINLKATAVDDGTGTNAKVTANLVKNGALISDDALYNQMTTVANITREDGTTSVIPMDLQNNNFICDVPTDPGETIKIIVHAEGANMYRDSDEIEFTAAGIPTSQAILRELGPIPSPIVVKGVIIGTAKTSLDLSDYWESSDPSEVKITYRAEVENDSLARAEISGSNLAIYGKEKGNTKVIVYASDSVGNSSMQTADVEIKGILGSIIPIIIIAGAIVLIIIVLIILLTVGSKPLQGYLYYSVSTDGTSFGREEVLALSFMGKEEKLGNIATDTILTFMDLQKVIISGNKTGITVTNKSKSCEVKDQFGASRKKIALLEGNSCTVECLGNDGSEAVINMRYAVEEEY